MTYQESEYSKLLTELLKFIEKFENPYMAVEILKEVGKINGQIPIYPGIVVTCFKDMVKKADKSAPMEKGVKVAVNVGENRIFGTLVGKDVGELFLENVFVMKPVDNLKVPLDDIDQVYEFKTDVLKTLWPSLVFDKKED